MNSKTTSWAILVATSIALFVASALSILSASADALSFAAVATLPAGAGPVDVVTADFNGDGRLDLAVPDIDGNSVSVLLGAGNGTFALPSSFAVGAVPVRVVVGDVNRDGRLDLAVSNLSSHTVSILLGDGAGQFGAAMNIALVGSDPRGLAIKRTNIFKDDHYCLFLQAVRELKEAPPFKLVAYVLMPDHCHLIVNPRDGKITDLTGALKGLSARYFIDISPHGAFLLAKPAPDGATHQVWQDSFKAFPLWSDWLIWQKINYIHNNPLRARLVKSAADYR